MRSYQRLLNISYKDHVTKEEVCRRIQAAIGEYDEFLTLVKKRKLRIVFAKLAIVWPCFKVYWFSKDNPTRHSERKKKKRQTEEEVGRQYQRVARNGFTISARAAENICG